MRIQIIQDIIDKIRKKRKVQQPELSPLEKCRQRIMSTAKSCGKNLWIGGFSSVTPQTEL